MSVQRYFVYLILCADSTFYVGFTTNLVNRFHQHQMGQGARYTRVRRPLELVAFWEHRNRSAAIQAEKRIKRLSPAQKLSLVSEYKSQSINE